MASVIHEIENNEALLLLYIAGELSVEDRLEVEQMLAGDAGLVRELARIESACNSAISVLQKLDSDRSLVPAENHAIRQAMRAMKQWQVDRLSRQPVILPPARMKIPVWVYPLGSVAALLIGTIAWWGFGGFSGRGSPSGSMDSGPIAMTGSASPLPGTDSPGPTPSPIPDSTPDHTLDPALPRKPLALTVPTSDESIANRLDNSLAGDSDPADTLAEAQTQASSLENRSDSASVISEIFPTESNP